METTGFFGAGAGLLLGLILGSFVGMASWRWPRELSWLTPSACPHCHARLGFKNLFPVLSWVLQKRKSHCCQQPVSARYALTELANGLLLAIAGAVLGLTPEFVIIAILLTTLVMITVIDFEHYLVPDGANLTIALTGGAWLYLHPPFAYWEPIASVAQCLLIGVMLAWGYSKLRGRDMMGWGDVKMMTASALWIYPQNIPIYLFISGFTGVLLGLVWKRLFKVAEFPFCPALAFSLVSLIVWQYLHP